MNKYLGEEDCLICEGISGKSMLHWGQILKASFRKRINVDIVNGMSASELEKKHGLKENAGYDFIRKYKAGMSDKEKMYERLYDVLGEKRCRICKEELEDEPFSFSQVVKEPRNVAITKSLNSNSPMTKVAEKHDICLATAYNRNKKNILKNKQ